MRAFFYALRCISRQMRQAIPASKITPAISTPHTSEERQHFRDLLEDKEDRESENGEGEERAQCAADVGNVEQQDEDGRAAHVI